jgi:hypothetical protein
MRRGCIQITRSSSVLSATIDMVITAQKPTYIVPSEMGRKTQGTHVTSTRKPTLSLVRVGSRFGGCPSRERRST